MNSHLVSLRIKVREKMNPYLSKFRKKKLLRYDFSIISNNCWGGHVYRYFGLPYMSPTIGLFFFADDYMLFLNDIEGFINAELEFTTRANSKHPIELSSKKYSKVPIGKLVANGKEINIVFLHYKSQEEALDKWNRRKNRINYNNLIVKNSYQNGCNDAIVKEFSELPYDSKIFFSHKPFNFNCVKLYKEFQNEEYVINDTINFKKYIDLVEFINSTYKTE